VAIVLALAFVLLELWAFGISVFVELFPDHPFLASGILLLVGVGFLLCIVGARMGPRTITGLASRTVLLLVSAIAGVWSFEILYVASVYLAVDPSPEAYFILAGGLVLVAFAAALIKITFGWRAPFWLVFVAAVAAVVVAIMSAGALTFLA
jgi:hypothetical protein